MSVESLRAELIDNNNQIMSRPLLWGAMTQRQRNLVIAAKSALAMNDPTTNNWLARLDTLAPETFAVKGTTMAPAAVIRSMFETKGINLTAAQAERLELSHTAIDWQQILSIAEKYGIPVALALLKFFFGIDIPLPTPAALKDEPDCSGTMACDDGCDDDPPVECDCCCLQDALELFGHQLLALNMTAKMLGSVACCPCCSGCCE